MGLPRSGTTWLARVLASADGVGLVHEPDNPWISPFAFRVKRDLPGHVYPLLDPDEAAPGYERLWREAFGLEPCGWIRGWSAQTRDRVATRLMRLTPEPERRRAMISGRRPLSLGIAEALASPRRPPDDRPHRVVKSVFAALSVEWIAARTPVRPIVVLRSPLNVISSWKELGWLTDEGSVDLLGQLGAAASQRLSASSAGLPLPGDAASSLTRATYLLGLLSRRLLDARTRHPEWRFVTHEDLAERPHDRIEELARDVGLPWSSASDRAIDSMNRPGSAYRTLRVGAMQKDVWRERLSPDEAAEVQAVLDGMHLDEARG